jgi:hypothetical protein
MQPSSQQKAKDSNTENNTFSCMKQISGFGGQEGGEKDKETSSHFILSRHFKTLK